MTASTDKPAPPMPAGGEKYGAWYDHAAAEIAVEYFPLYLRHTEGEWAGRPFVLADWQADRIVRPLFGWKRSDGARLIRTVWLEVPRKNGKTEFCAGVSVVALGADGEHGAQCYAGAIDKEQAKIVFDKAGAMVSMSPELSEVMEVFKTAIYCSHYNSSFKPLTGKARTKHGFSPHFFVGDEVHEWPDGELYQVVRDGEAARRQPIELLVTTAGQKGRGFAAEMHDYALGVRDGAIEDPTFLPVIFAADDEDDWTDPEVWAKANPNLGVSVKTDFLREQCERARSSPRLENNFRRYHLNQWVGQLTRWLPMDHWNQCTADPTDTDGWKRFEDSLEGRECWGGLDLGATSDFTARALIFDRLPGEDRHPVLWRFWLPEEMLERRARESRVPFEAWHRIGALSVTGGNVTDYAEVERDLKQDADRYAIRLMGYDPWHATMLVNNLMDEGFPLLKVRQGYASLSAPSKELEAFVLGHKIDHGNNPVAKWMAGNVAVSQDPAGNIKPDKSKAADKIDGIAALVNALAARATRDEEEPSPYEKRGLIVM